MNIALNTEYFLQNNLTLEEVLLLLSISNSCDMVRARDSLINKGYITRDGLESKALRITDEGINKINNIIYTPKVEEATKEETESIESFADKLRLLFPKGFKNGTKHSWRGTNKDIVDKLKKFYFVYGDKYSRKQIYNATKQYVEEMTDNPYMRTLKYFIFKKDINQGAEVSDLADFLENWDEKETSQDWRNTMV